MADMPTTPHQRQPVCQTAFPNHGSNNQTYGATILEGHGMQGFEGLVNIADGQYYELDESQHANQILEDGKLGAWSRDSNAVSGGREDNAQTSIEEFFSLELNPWSVATSQSLHRRAYPHLPIAPQHDQQGQDYPPSSIARSAQQSAFFPFYGSQPFQSAPQPSSLSPSSDTVGLDEHDLRRLRNTAASARFRVKKKLREQSLQRSSQQKREKLAGLKARVLELETENKWLKSLLMEKYDADDIKVLRDSFKKREDVQLENKEEAIRDDNDEKVNNETENEEGS